MAMRMLHFNSQPHEEADPTMDTPPQIERNFNSQPHEEADEDVMQKLIDILISTHSLTKRLTEDARRSGRAP